MKSTRVYNIILPFWLLWIFPQMWLAILPANLAVDCLVLFLALTALKIPGRAALLKRLWWRFWLLGFAADAVGVVWMLLGLQAGEWWSWWAERISRSLHNPFGDPLAFLWTLSGVVLAGVCIYFFDRRALRCCPSLSAEQCRRIALTMALLTAPWLFFVSLY